jgi:ubiquinone biosynthesis monooxygenase Coq7
MNPRTLHRLDATLASANQVLTTLLAHPAGARAPKPNHTIAANGSGLSASDTALSGALMRVNHVGEVCAQALYNSQALGARVFSGNEVLAAHFDAAGKEEGNHLAWTHQRLDELGSRPSLLNPFWYAGAFGLGLLASRMGERVSLGFVVETERQVEAHLASHLARLPEKDHASRAVVAQMKEDEARHAIEAQQAGATALPLSVTWAMKMAAKVMTTVAHRV